MRRSTLLPIAFSWGLLFAIGCGGSDPVPPQLLGRWVVVSQTCDCDSSDPHPVVLIDLRTDSATLTGVDSTRFDVSAESDGDDCVAFGSGTDGFGRDIDATTLCTDTTGDLRGAFVAHSDDSDGTWYYAYRHQ